MSSSTFSPSLACLLNLLTLSFQKEKILISLKSGIFIISFMDYVFRVIFKMSSPYLRLFGFFPMLSSRCKTIQPLNLNPVLNFSFPKTFLSHTFSKYFRIFLDLLSNFETIIQININRVLLWSYRSCSLKITLITCFYIITFFACRIDFNFKGLVLTYSICNI